MFHIELIDAHSGHFQAHLFTNRKKLQQIMLVLIGHLLNELEHFCRLYAFGVIQDQDPLISYLVL